MEGGNSNATKELLRSMLNAWYDLTKDEAGAMTAQLEAEVALQQEMNKPDQVTKIIREVLFYAWRRYATNPSIRLKRKNRPDSKSAWIQRMIVPKNRSARGAEDGDRGEGSGGKEGATRPLESTLKKEVADGITPSSRQDSQGCHHLGSRYLRVQTIPPDSIRYGRNASSPAPPQAVPPSVSHRPVAACRRSWGARFRNRIRRNKTSVGDDTGKTGRSNDPRDKPARDTSSSRGSTSSGVGRGTRSPRGEEDERRRLDKSGDALDSNDDFDRGCCPPVSWDVLEPWERQNPRAPWMTSSSSGGEGYRRRCPLRSGEARRKRPLIASDDKVLRQVNSLLNRFADIDRRRQRIAALLLLQDPGKGGIGSIRSDAVYYHHPSRNRRSPRVAQVHTDGDTVTFETRLPCPTGRSQAGTGPESRTSVGPEGGKTNSSSRKHNVVRATRREGGSCNSDGGVLMPGCDALTTVLSRFAVDGVGRDIARTRQGRRRMSDGNCCGETRVPSSSLPEGPFGADETRGVLFGFSDARLGRYCQREDRWL